MVPHFQNNLFSSLRSDGAIIATIKQIVKLRKPITEHYKSVMD